jgi:hypothetical protein
VLEQRQEVVDGRDRNVGGHVVDGGGHLVDRLALDRILTVVALGSIL